MAVEENQSQQHLPEFNPQPKIATNQPELRVDEALRGFIAGATSEPAEVRLDIASAYFNIGGYARLADALDGAEKIRLLLGVEPDDMRKPRVLSGDKREHENPEIASAAKIKRAIDGLAFGIARDRDLLGFTLETKHLVGRLVSWLRSNNTEIRLLRKRFLHGKVYLISKPAGKVLPNGGVIAGSSNFTHAGLTTNAEFNLGNFESETVKKAQAWFDEQWADAELYDLAELFEGLYAPHDPQLIYLRMLWELEKTDMEEPVDTRLPLTESQKHGLLRARRILDYHNGVLVADEVGLGKTYIAGELICDATEKRRQRALVIAPATLRDGTWKAFKGSNNLNVEVRSFDELIQDKRLMLDGKQGGKKVLDANDLNNYALIVIDEAHNARSPSTQKAFALRKLIEGTPRKQLVLLTATPVNNSLWDLYNLLTYFLHNDGVFADAGINSLRDHFSWAMREDPDDLSPKHLFDVLDPVTVRRTRKFIKQHYTGETYIVEDKETKVKVEKQVKFPTPKVSRVDYDFESVLPGFFKKFAKALEPVSNDEKKGRKGERLTMARYSPSTYLLQGAERIYELQNAGLLRSLLLKRFESSPHAFANTCQRMANEHNAFLSLLDEQGHISTGAILKDWVATDSDDTDAVDRFLDHNRDEISDSSEYDVKALRKDVVNDRDLLQKFADEAKTVTQRDDPTLKAIVKVLAKIAKDAEKGLTEEDKCDRRKVLIFSYYADTVEWIYEYLAEQVRTNKALKAYDGRVASISGSGGADSDGNVGKDDVLWGFAPKTMEAPKGFDDDKYDIVITTDVLAEGVNLQQAQHIINYDLPWNPMRLVQRHGRIDRIGSHHSKVFLHCVFPDNKLDDLLGLEERIRRKIRQAAVSVGVESQVIPAARGAERVFAETREEIERLKLENASLFEQGGVGSGAMSGEEFRRELDEALKDSEIKRQIETLPWGSGTGMTNGSLADSGNTEFVFCVRVADHKNVLFRNVEVNAAGEIVSAGTSGASVDEESEVVEESEGKAVRPTGLAGDTLACLFKARPPKAWKTKRVLTDKTHDLACHAWISVADEILHSWNKLTDPKAFSHPLERAQRNAVAVLENLKQFPDGVSQEDIDEAVNKIQAPLSPGRIRAIRSALGEHQDSPTEQAALILKTIAELGLEKFTPPPPLPVVTKDDIFPVCWVALTPPESAPSEPAK